MGRFGWIAAAATGALIAACVWAGPVQAAPRGPIIVTASSASMPAKYRKGMHCARLLFQDYTGPAGHRADGVAEIQIAWHLPGGHPQSAAGSWDGTRIVPDRPIPRIAAMVTRGAAMPVKTGGYDRQICGAADRRLYALTTSDSASGVRPTYRAGYGGPRLQRSLDAQTWESVSGMFAQAYADKVAADAAAAQAAADAAAAADVAAWQARIDAWQAACAPGGTVRVQHGPTVEVWTCHRKA